jgi:hypothetical protein
LVAVNPLLLSVVLLATPADELRAAAADIEHVAPQLRPTTRYLTLYNIEPAQGTATIRVVSYVLNALSRTRAISTPTRVTPTLWRVNLTAYAPIDDDRRAWTAAWEKLAESDPYFHIRTEVAVGNGRKVEKSKGANVAQSLRPLDSSTLRLVTIDGGWIDLAAAARLHAATLSAGPLLRADYFVGQATIPPRYYEFTGIADTESDFLKSVGVDRATIDRLRADIGANLIISGVTAKPRRIVWSQGPLGGVYSTLDVERVEAERDPIRRPLSAGGLVFKYDVSEWFALAPNGLWRTALYSSAGKRQDSVPDRVAKDFSDPHADGVIVPLLSCIRCHREGGLRPFRDDQSRLLTGRVDLYSPDPRIVQRAAEFYDEPRLQRQMTFDRQTYTDATARATGNLTPEQLADALAASIRRFAYQPVTPDQAATEVGLDLESFRELLAPTRDPIILLLLEGNSVLRGQWESSFAEAALAAHVSPPSRRDAEKKE